MRIKKEHLRFEFCRGRKRRAKAPFRRLRHNFERGFKRRDIRFARPEVKKINPNDSSTKIFASSSLLTAGAGAGVSVSAISSPSALTIKDRLLEDLACARVAATDKTALFAMTDAKDMVLCSFSFALLLLSGCGSASANMPTLKFLRVNLSPKKERDCCLPFFCIFSSLASKVESLLSLSLSPPSHIIIIKSSRRKKISFLQKNKNEEKNFDPLPSALRRKESSSSSSSSSFFCSRCCCCVKF